MTYGLRYILEWRSENEYSNLYKIEIAQKDYVGQPTIKNLGSSPILRQEAANSGICGTSLEFTIQSDFNGELEDFFTNDNKNFKIVEYCNNAIIWEGFILPELYSEPYIAAPYDINITASDQLAVLKNIDFTPAGDIVFLQIIDKILKKTGLSLGYEIICSLKPDYMGDNESMFAEIGIDDRSFTGLTCFDALAAIMLSINATITQRHGRWLICRNNDIAANSVFYTSNLVLETVAPNLAATIGKYGVESLYPIGNLTMLKQPAKSEFKIEYAPILAPSLFFNSETSSDDNWTYNSFVTPPGVVDVLYGRVPSESGLKRVCNWFELNPAPSTSAVNATLSQTVGIVESPDEFSLSVSYAFSKKKYGGSSYIPVSETPTEGRFKMKITSNGVDPSDGAAKTLYLSSNGWTEQERFFEITGNIAGISNKDNFYTVTLKFGGFPLTGNLTIEFINPASIPSRPSGYYTIVAITNVFLTYVNIPGYSSNVALIENASQKGNDVSLAFSDIYGFYAEERLVYNTFRFKGNSLYGGNWTINGEADTFYKTILQDYANTYGLVKSRFSGVMSGEILLYNLYLETFSNSLLKIEQYSIDQRLEEMSCELLHIPLESIAASDFEITTTEGGKVVINSSDSENLPSGDSGNWAAVIHDHAGQLIRPQTLILPSTAPASLNEGEIALYLGDTGFDYEEDEEETISSITVMIGDVPYQSVDGVVSLPAYPEGGGGAQQNQTLTFAGYQNKIYDGSSPVTVEIPTSLPASDVANWAKEPNPPKYTAEDVGALPEDAINSGTANRLAYYNGSKSINDLSSNIGSNTKPMYLSAGVPKASSANVGTATKPIYMEGGELKQCTGLSQDTTGNASTATKLKDSVSLWGQEFDGSGDIDGDMAINGKVVAKTLILPSTAPASLNEGETALYLGDTGFGGESNGAVSLWGQSFDGGGDIDGSISNTEDITPKTSLLHNIGSSLLSFLSLFVKNIIAPIGESLSIYIGSAAKVVVNSEITTIDSNGLVTGNLRVDGAISQGSLSDRRLKKNFKGVTSEEALGVISSLNPVNFEWQEEATKLGGYAGESCGFIADEFEQSIKNSGRDIWGEYRAIDQTKAIPYMVKMLQDAHRQLVELNKEIELLKNK